jgi:hypothetical protein
MPIPTAQPEEATRQKDLGQAVFMPPDILDIWLKLWKWTWQQLSRGEFPGPYEELARKTGFDNTLKMFQLAGLSYKTSWWCKFFLREPTAPDELWKYWDFQVPPADHIGHMLEEAGAEVGKSRDITSKHVMLALTRPNGSSLICAPLDAHVQEIVNAMEWQLDNSPLLADSIKKIKRTPYVHYQWRNGFQTHFRPLGSYGTSLRGLHIADLLDMDEAVKAKNKQIFEEFWGRGLPFSQFALRSTPDGDRSTEFYKLCARARNQKKEKKKPGKRNVDFKLFHMSQEMKPPPYWDEERKEEFIVRFGGEDTPEYQRVVLGNWGDPENSVFPWFQFKRLLKFNPDYRLLKVNADEARGTITLKGVCYEIDSNNPDDVREVMLLNEEPSLEGFDIASVIKTFFSKSSGLYFGGTDLGYSKDPSEIYVKLILGKTHKLMSRLQMKGVSYDMQCEAIAALDDIYDPGDNTMGWGVDFGNAGSAVVHDLHNLEKFDHKSFKDRITGYKFGESMDAVDEDGNVLYDRGGKPLRMQAKELATNLLTKKMQRQELEYPLGDRDIEVYYPNHTYREGERHKIYRKVDDHIIDADRATILRVVLPSAVKKEFFACGTN